jgi:hypothetical protein
VKPDAQARLAAVLGFVMLIAGTFAASVHTRLVVPGDPVKTATNILASPSLFRLGIAGSLVVYIVFIVYAVLLYRLLRIVHATHALIMLALALVGSAIALANQVHQFAVLDLLTDSKAFASNSGYAQATLFLRLHGHGNLIGVIFWGLWLFPLGLLVYRSGFFPRALGVLLMIGCFGWLVLFVQRFAFPEAEALGYARFAAHIAELAWVLWLAIRGVDIVRWEQRALQAAGE